jgi:hypothetical protein
MVEKWQAQFLADLTRKLERDAERLPRPPCGRRGCSPCGLHSLLESDVPFFSPEQLGMPLRWRAHGRFSVSRGDEYRN